MANKILSIPLSQLVPHPDNPNRMSKATFAKLVRNIERTKRYEPLVVRLTTDRKTGKISESSQKVSSSTDKYPPDGVKNRPPKDECEKCDLPENYTNVAKNKLRRTTDKKSNLPENGRNHIRITTEFSGKFGENGQKVSSSTDKSGKSGQIGQKIRSSTDRSDVYTPGSDISTNEGDIYQIINGHHRWLALKKLGYEQADVIVWDVDDGEADILLGTLNRLCGSDMLDKKVALLKRLSERTAPAELARLLPNTKKQIEKLIQLTSCKLQSPNVNRKSEMFLDSLVFFVSGKQKKIVEDALNYVMQSDNTFTAGAKTKAARRAAALVHICEEYLGSESVKKNEFETLDEGSEKFKS